MRTSSYIVTILLTLLIAAGCQKEIPEPEVKIDVLPMSTVHGEDDMPVNIEANKEEFQVHHHVKGDRIFVECMIPSISFREDSENQGKMLVFVNGKKKEEISTAAFIIKGLAKGSHHIRLEVVRPNNEPYHLEKEFTVSIP